MSGKTAKRLGRMADYVVRSRRLSQAERDEIVTVLRDGEARILDLQQELRVLRNVVKPLDGPKFAAWMNNYSPTTHSS